MSINAIEELRAKRAELEALYHSIRSSIESDEIQHDIIQKYKLDTHGPKTPAHDRRFPPSVDPSRPPVPPPREPSRDHTGTPPISRDHMAGGYDRSVPPDTTYGYPYPDGYGPPPTAERSYSEGYPERTYRGPPTDRTYTEGYGYPPTTERPYMPGRSTDDTARAPSSRFVPPSDLRAFTDAYARLAETERRGEEEVQTYLDLVFLVDCTASMTPTIRSVAAKLMDILDALGTTFSHVNTRVAFVGYRDVGCRQPFIIYDFNTPDTMRARINLVDVEGNADDAEDVLGGYAEALNLSWASGAHRILLHFLDNPPHGRRFHSGRISDRYLDSEPPAPHKPSSWLDECVRQLCEKRIYVCMFAVSGYADQILRKTIEEFSKAFTRVPFSKGKDKFTNSKLEAGDDETNDFFTKVLAQVTASMIASGAKRRTA